MSDKNNPFTIIPHRSDEEPFVCLKINKHWLPALHGMIYPFRYPERWLGTLEENKQARLDVLAILDQIMTAEECDMNDCCVDLTVVEHRYNPSTLAPEISIDGGTTWQPDPNDPQHSVIQLPPPISSGLYASKCDAASNGLAHVKDLVQGTSDALETAATVAEFVILIVELILLVAISAITGGTASAAFIEAEAAIFASARGLFALGQTAFNDYWTSDNYSIVLCTFFCNMGDDGSFNDNQFASVISELKATLPPSFAADIITDSLKTMGRKGLNNICAYGTAEIQDCEGCDCGCDWSAWVVRAAGVGSIVSQDETQMTVDAQLSGGAYYVQIKSPGAAICCSFNAEILSGEQNGTRAAKACGTANQDDENNWNFSYFIPGPAVNTVSLASSVPFRVRFTSA